MKRTWFLGGVFLAEAAYLQAVRVAEAPQEASRHKSWIAVLGGLEALSPEQDATADKQWWPKEGELETAGKDFGMGRRVRLMLKSRFGLPSRLQDCVMRALPVHFSMVAAAGPLMSYVPEHKIGVVVVEVGTLLWHKRPLVVSRGADVVHARVRAVETVGRFFIQQLLVSPDGSFGYISADCFGQVFDGSPSPSIAFDEMVAMSSDGEMLLEYRGPPSSFYTVRELRSGVLRRLDAPNTAGAKYRDGKFSLDRDTVASIAYIGVDGAEARIWIWDVRRGRLLHYASFMLGRPRPSFRPYPTFAFDGERVALCDGSDRRGHLFVARSCQIGRACELIRDDWFQSCEDVFLPTGLVLQVLNPYDNATKVMSVRRWDGRGTTTSALASSVEGFEWERWRGRFSPDGRKAVVWPEYGVLRSSVPIGDEPITGPVHVWAFTAVPVPETIRAPLGRFAVVAAGPLVSVAFTADSRWLVVGSGGERALRFFDMEGRETATFPTWFEVTAIGWIGERGSWLE